MQFHSTRNAGHRVGFSEALVRGLAPDGGLYLPGAWPALDLAAAGEPALRAVLDDAAAPVALAGLAAQLIGSFAAGDGLAAQMGAICADAFDFPAPLVWLDGHQLAVLELFHGPTAAFKDFGARFLAACLTRLRGAAGPGVAAAGGAAAQPAAQPLKILVATSGDTGGAVAAAFHRRPGIEVAVLYPKGLVSPTQERQLTCWGDNVASFAVRGSFDDCQRLVKEAFVDRELRARMELSSANSINLGRLLPQAVYYFATSVAIRHAHGGPASYVIPSGNLGNATACLMARQMGAPIADIVLAHNANRTVPDYLATGELELRPSVATLASAMDVGAPSNLERLQALYPDVAALRGVVSATSVDDAAIRARIQTDYRRYGRIWCPHTAVAAEAYARLPPAVRARGRWVLVGTAHPAKFREVVEPLVGREVPVPPNLARLFERPSRFTEIEPTLATLRSVL